MQLSVRPILNPSGRFVGVKFDVEMVPSLIGLHLRYDSNQFEPEMLPFFEAIQAGLSEYAAEPPEEFGPLPGARFTVVELETHPTATDAWACKFGGLLGAREFHKRVYRNEK